MEAKNKPLYKDIIEGTYRQYTIPVYQRTYTWEKKQCKQLYDDIISCIKQNNKHYLGSLVYSEKESTDDGESFTFCQIIDGQQRITTVILLLKAIYDQIKDEENRIKLRIYDSLYNKNCEEQYKLKLQSIDNDNDQLKKVLLGQYSELDDLSNITKNYYYFIERIQESIKEGIDCETLFKGICNLEIVEIKLEEKDKPQLIFESINSTGKGLNDAEKIRNFLLMGITNSKEQKKYYDTYWVGLVDAIGNNNVQNFFYDYLVTKESMYIKESELYERFKAYYYSIADIEKIGKDILKYAEYYKLIVCNNSKLYGKKTNDEFKIFNELRHHTIDPFMMKVCDDYSDICKLYDKGVTLTEEEKVYEEKRELEFNEIIRFFGNYAIRRNICEIPSSSLRRFYASLYDYIFKNEINKKNYLNSIKTYLCTIITSDQFPNDETFKEHLMEVNLYKRSKLLNIFFEIIENKGKEKIDWDNLSIEHILPQTPDKGWKMDLGKDFQYVYEKYLNTLGNLSITGYNSEYKNKTFDIKKKALLEKQKDHTLKIFTLNEELLEPKVKKWDEKIILKRATRLADILIKKYPYPKNIDPSIEFNSYIEVYVDDVEKKFIIESDYKIAGFKLLNKKVSSNTYIEVYKNMLVELYQINPNILMQLAEDNWKYEMAKRVYISTDENVISSPMKISEDIEIYVESNFNRDSILELIINILSKYNNELDSSVDFCLLYENKIVE